MAADIDWVAPQRDSGCRRCRSRSLQPQAKLRRHPFPKDASALGDTSLGSEKRHLVDELAPIEARPGGSPVHYHPQ